MPKFLIEVPHDPEMSKCALAVQAFMTSGSHFVANAEWGCHDGDHRSWIIVEVDSKEEARGIVPPLYRSQAHVIGLNKFTLREIEEILREHKK
jgi:hypothetical protein